MYDELIKALRYCISDNADDCDLCPYQSDCKSNGTGQGKMIRDAADALEAAEKRIEELEARIPKWTMLKDEMPKPHTNVLVSGIEAINNTRVYKVMVNDNGTLRPTDYAPSIMWDYWMPFDCPNCGARMRGEKQ